MEKETIEKIVDKGVLYEIYRADDEGRFDVGHILKITDKDTLIAKVNKNYESNGLLAIWSEDILMLKRNTRYLTRIQKVEDQRDLNDDTYNDVNDSFDAVIKHALDNSLNVELFFYPPFGDSIYGTLISYDGKIISLKEIDTKGRNDGIIYVQKNDLAACECEI